MVAFLLDQRTRQHRAPQLPFALFRDRNFAVKSLVAATVQVGMRGPMVSVAMHNVAPAMARAAPTTPAAVEIAPLQRIRNRTGGGGF